MTNVSSFAQSSIDFKSIVALKDTNYAEIDSLLKPFRRDKEELLGFIELAKRSNYNEGLAFAYIQKGILERNLSEYPEALVSLKTALKYAEKCDNIDFRVITWNMLGVVHRRMDQIREALDYHKNALELAESSGKTTETGIRNIAVARNSIGNIYISLRQPELAEPEFLASIKIEEKTNNKLGLAINNQNLGSIYEEGGDLEKALEHYQKSLAYNIDINSDLGKVICNNSIGQVYLKQKKYLKAISIIYPTIKMANEIGDPYYLAMAKLNYGWALFEVGKLEESENYLKESLEISKERNMGYFVAESYRLMAQIAEKNGNFKEALEYHKLFSENEELYLNENNQKYVADLILKYDSDRKKNQIEILEKENEIVNLKLAGNRKFLIFGALGIGLLIGLLYFTYHQNILKKEKEYLALEQRMMRSQMNPHFIFNSLNSIKLYIISNEKDKAVYYLNKFSKLIRTILATSKEKDITLKEELDTMELYMNIENIRFSNIIHFNMDVSEDIPLKQIKLPSMILQPFLENAIWHGLSSKEGHKQIDLRVIKDSAKTARIEIEDNGVGREKSKEIKSKKTLKNRSIGIDLTQQRLENYYQNIEGEHSIEIQDLYVDDLASGTKVVLKIPFNFES
jgi:tetratricopeptide (TPR) repeat protein